MPFLVEPQLAPLTPLDAGTVWRNATGARLFERAKALGLLDDAQVARALDAIVEHTEALEAISDEQRRGDGEYDSRRAEEANDAGVAHSGAERWAQAHKAFTEAVRLSPDRPAYHANRASAALRLGNASGAAEDAEHAVRLAPGHLTALLRAAKARMLLRQPEKALAHFEAALVLSPANVTARRGAASATAMAEEQRATRDRESSASARGERPALKEGVSEMEAADLLLSAEEMLRSSPDREAARCWRVEGLIYVRAYAAALEACAQLMPGTADSAYLTAEALWRSNQLEKAEASVRPFQKNSAKCDSLARLVARLKAGVEMVTSALEGETSTGQAMCALDELLELKAVKGTNMQAELLRCRALLRLDRASALEDLAEALRVHPDSVEALLLRAGLHDEAGDKERCFLDLRRVSIVAPDRAGTWPALQSAARAALKQQARERGTHRARPPPVPGQPAGEVPSAYAVLELSNVPSTEREVTRAYRLAAAKWHPDKWASAGEEERRESERRWAEISAAYKTCLAEAEG